MGRMATYVISLSIDSLPDCEVSCAIFRDNVDVAILHAKEWLVERQPRLLFDDLRLNVWRVFTYSDREGFTLLAEGHHDGKVTRQAPPHRSYRGRQEARSGASEARNGLWDNDDKASKGRSKRKQGLATGTRKKVRRYKSTLSPARERVLQTIEAARAVLREERESQPASPPREDRMAQLIQLARAKKANGKA
jgi:hypothetical protein